MLKRFRKRFTDLVQHKASNRRNAESRTPPVLQDARRVPYGPFTFRAVLPKRLAYTVEASTNLAVWAPISHGVAGEQPLDFVDSEARRFRYRFYRVGCGGLYSPSVIGYAAVTLPPGDSLIGSPFSSGDSKVGQLFGNWPDGTCLKRYEPRLSKVMENLSKAGRWTNPAERLNPGEGMVFFNPTSDYKEVSFYGEVKTGTFSLPIPGGFSLRSSFLPRPGNILEDFWPINAGSRGCLFRLLGLFAKL